MGPDAWSSTRARALAGAFAAGKNPRNGSKQMAQLVPGKPRSSYQWRREKPAPRPLRHHRGTYEIVVGERRWRAGQREIARRPVPGTDRQPQSEPGYKVLKRCVERLPPPMR